MSGKKQHYIPRLLLRAFRLNRKGKVARVFVYRPDRSYVSPVEDVAAERFFYSDLATDGSETLDDVITNYENGLTTDLASIAGATSGKVDPEAAARVVTHLIVRNDHVRGVMREGASQFADLIKRLMGSDEKVGALLGLGGPIPTARFRKNFTEKIVNDPVFQAIGLPEPVLLSLAYMMLRESAEEGFSVVTEAISGMAKRLHEEGPELARDAHARTLSDSLAPHPWLQSLRELHWHVEEVEQDTFILPDFVGLALDQDGDAGSLVGLGRKGLNVIAMPLTPSRMLIGTREGATFDVGRFNELAAPQCLSFFVSAYSSPELSSLATAIGSGVQERLRETLEKSSVGFRAEIESGPAPDSPPSEAGAWQSTPPANVKLHTDFLTTEDGQRLSSVLAQIIGFAHRRFDVSALLRIHVPSDYEQTLMALDRGKLADLEPPPVATDRGLSIAYNVQVEQNDTYGTAVVLRDGIAHSLLSDNDQAFSFAASVVFGQLARIGARAFLIGVFPDGITAGTEVDRLLTPFTAPAYESWLVARHVCLFEADRREFHRQQLLELLEALPRKLEPIRRDYRSHHDVDRFLDEALTPAAQILTTAAAAIVDVAHGLEDTASDEQFASRLQSMGYLKWVELLRSDLLDLWEEGAAYPNQERFFVLNRHLERLLLAGAIFIWDDQGRGKVEVPFWSDWEWLMAEVSRLGHSDPDPTQHAP